MDYKKLEEILQKRGQPEFRLKQIIKAIFCDGVKSFDQITTISKDLKRELAEELEIYPFRAKEVVISNDKRAIKALFELKDGNLIESVLISPKPGDWSACISSQAGCAMACDFCATGKLGFKRNLTVDEIVSQAIFWRGHLKENDIAGAYTSVVYMGMGEPFMNWENVKESIRVLTDKNLGNFSNRGLSVSTSGIVSGIERFADTFGQVNLAISLHFASDEKRDKYMPVNKIYNLDKLKKSLDYYLSKNKRRLFIEYIMLKGINDDKEDALALIKYLSSIRDKKLIVVNLIKYNSIDSDFIPSTTESVQRFKELIKKSGISCTIRKSIGEDIHGACGQLAGKKQM